jgi:hypothetical protein
MIISRSVLRMRNVSDKSRREDQNTHFMLKDFFPENCDFCEIMLKNLVEPDRLRMT